MAGQLQLRYLTTVGQISLNKREDHRQSGANQCDLNEVKSMKPECNASPVRSSFAALAARSRLNDQMMTGKHALLQIRGPVSAFQPDMCCSARPGCHVPELILFAQGASRPTWMHINTYLEPSSCQQPSTTHMAPHCAHVCRFGQAFHGPHHCRACGKV